MDAAVKVSVTKVWKVWYDFCFRKKRPLWQKLLITAVFINIIIFAIILAITYAPGVVADVIHPIDVAAIKLGFGRCESVKRIVGVSHDQVRDLNLHLLTLKFISPFVNMSYAIMDSPYWLTSNPNFKRNQTLYIYLHGFTDNPGKDSFSLIRSALVFDSEDRFTNILALDGSALIKWKYLRSSSYVKFIGMQLAHALKTMHNEYGIKSSQIHLIGHSLGAHIAGFTGKTYLNVTGRKIGRISGLDPAGPCFSDVGEDLRLSKNDATFVDVIHTNAGVFGMEQPIGHVDFYPNGGSKQPGCVVDTCSHSRAWELYAFTIMNPDIFPALQCQDWEAFKVGNCTGVISDTGFAAKNTTRGVYFLQTDWEQPFGRGENGTIYKDDESIVTKTVKAIYSKG